MADRTDPYRSYNFKLEIQGVTEGHFTKCDGLGVEVEVIRYREAGNNQIVHAIPGKATYQDITLSYGLTDSKELWEWMLEAVKGTVARKNVSILMLDSSGASEVTRWNLADAWPSSWKGAPLDTMGQEIAIESLTLVYEALERA